MESLQSIPIAFNLSVRLQTSLQNMGTAGGPFYPTKAVIRQALQTTHILYPVRSLPFCIHSWVGKLDSACFDSHAIHVSKPILLAVPDDPIHRDKSHFLLPIHLYHISSSSLFRFIQHSLFQQFQTCFLCEHCCWKYKFKLLHQMETWINVHSCIEIYFLLGYILLRMTRIDTFDVVN